MKIISDKKLLKIPVIDSGEILVYIDKDFMVRKTVAEKLSLARKFLPVGYKLFVNSAWRSLELQKEYYDKTFAKIKKQNPGWSSVKIKKLTDKFVAPLEIIPPHSTGGAVDVSILDVSGRKINMGTKIGQDYDLDKTKTNSQKISKTAKRNRKLLVKAMEAAGFINYPLEWWHWSYGDRYWAAVLDKKYSIYKSIKK